MPPIEYFLAIDPSECVNSSQIIATLKNFFRDCIARFYNGTILFYALDHIFFKNFDFNNDRHKAFLQMFFNIEDTLAATGEIKQDNAHIICKKTL
ncbi:type 11 methyltransferase [Candidatus Magnetomorum sp. HK-1]|nr:type 11 methyltransferase [Candidatus Magnetomorum sp. HK-1]